MKKLSEYTLDRDDDTNAKAEFVEKYTVEAKKCDGNRYELPL